MHKQLSPRLAGTDRQKPEDTQGQAKPRWNKSSGMLASSSQITNKTKGNHENRKHQCHFRQAGPPLRHCQDINSIDAVPCPSDAKIRLVLSPTSVEYAPTLPMREPAPAQPS